MLKRFQRGLYSFYRHWISPLVARRPQSAGELQRRLDELGPQPAPLEPHAALRAAFGEWLGDGLCVRARMDSGQELAMEWALSLVRRVSS